MSITAEYLSEVVAHGPFALTRADVRKLAIAQGLSPRIADAAAFGFRKIDADPMSLADVADFLDRQHGAGFADFVREIA